MIKTKVTENEKQEDAMHQDPKNRRLGVFYYNPKDSRLFVPKRKENKWNSGSTANFAHPVTYLLFLPVVLVPLLILLIKR